MLAYVFWHVRRPGIDAAAYEARLAAFQGDLAREAPEGFRGAAVYATPSLPWLPAGASGGGYEDWYLLDSSAALDLLNDAAVSGPRQKSHDEAARSAAWGVAGLYGLRYERAAGGSVRHAVWFEKPSDTPYAALDALLRPLVEESGGSIWSRRMVLGPSPEFCLRTAAPRPLPPPLSGTPVVLRNVWPG